MSFNQILEKYEDRQRINSGDLQDLSKEELLLLKERVDTDIALISGKIDAVKAELQATGQYADHDWFSRAMKAKRIKGQLSQKIQNKLAQLRKKRSESADREYVRRILEAMDNHLDPATKQAILDDAQADVSVGAMA